MDFDIQTNAYIEANQSYANELFAIARQHHLTYMALNEKAMDIYRPVLDWFLQRSLFDECIDYMCKNIPDCIERTLFMKMVIDRQKDAREFANNLPLSPTGGVRPTIIERYEYI